MLFLSFQPSTAFNIGFTPKNKRLRRQQGFVTSSSKSTSKVSNLINVFEKKNSASKTPTTPKGKKPPSGFSHLTTPMKNPSKVTPMKNLGRLFNKLQKTPKKMSAKVEPLDN